MKKLFFLTLLLTFVFLPKPMLAQKITHPKQAITDEQLNVILSAIRQKRNDAEKIAVFKDGVKDKGITIEQLMTLLNQYDTDGSKITCAEYAFPFTVNYRAFLKINDLFASESTKQQLEDFYSKNK